MAVVVFAVVVNQDKKPSNLSTGKLGFFVFNHFIKTRLKKNPQPMKTGDLSLIFVLHWLQGKNLEFVGLVLWILDLQRKHWILLASSLHLTCH